MKGTLDPKIVTIKDGAGKEYEYVIFKFPAVHGQEIIESLAPSAIVNLFPKLANRANNRQIRQELIAYAAVRREGVDIHLINETLVNQHVKDWEALTKLQYAIIQYNSSFLQDGRILSFFKDCALIHIPKIFKTLMDLLEQSSQAEKPRSTN